MAEQTPTDPNAALLVKHLPTIVRSLVEAIGAYGNSRLDAAIAPLLERIEALERAGKTSSVKVAIPMIEVPPGQRIQ